MSNFFSQVGRAHKKKLSFFKQDKPESIKNEEEIITSKETNIYSPSQKTEFLITTPYETDVIDISDTEIITEPDVVILNDSPNQIDRKMETRSTVLGTPKKRKIDLDPSLAQVLEGPVSPSKSNYSVCVTVVLQPQGRKIMKVDIDSNLFLKEIFLQTASKLYCGLPELVFEHKGNQLTKFNTPFSCDANSSMEIHVFFLSYYKSMQQKDSLDAQRLLEAQHATREVDDILSSTKVLLEHEDVSKEEDKMPISVRDSENIFNFSLSPNSTIAELVAEYLKLSGKSECTFKFDGDNVESNWTLKDYFEPEDVLEAH